jgi:Tfp pilus assembly protein PilO
MSSLLRNKNNAIALVAGGAVLVAVAVWFLLVSPERSKVGKIDRDIASVQSQIAERKAGIASPKAQIHIRASDSYRLSKAMPGETDMSGIVLTLNRLATKRGLNLSGITPSTQVLQAGFTVQPLAITLEGQFPSIAGFLTDVRRLVRVRKHTLAATGRLFSVDELDLSQDTDATKVATATKPGTIKATLTVDAFLFNGLAPGVLTPTTPSAPSGTVAAGATP